jgi:carboxylesterase type B
VGLLDQRFAMEWAQKYIHLFGGDLRRVTIAGESADGASAIHYIAARGGSGGPPPFQQALIQSGGWNPITNTSHLERLYKGFLKALGVDSLQAARRMPSMAIRNASFLLTFILHWGELGFGMYLPCTQNGN